MGKEFQISRVNAVVLENDSEVQRNTIMAISATQYHHVNDDIWVTCKKMCSKMRGSVINPTHLDGTWNM